MMSVIEHNRRVVDGVCCTLVVASEEPIGPHADALGCEYQRCTCAIDNQPAAASQMLVGQALCHDLGPDPSGIAHRDTDQWSIFMLLAHGASTVRQAMNKPTDLVAKIAAERFHSRVAATLDEAIGQACSETGAHALPSLRAVRRHLEAIEQAEVGVQAWRDARVRRLEAIDELLQTITYVASECTCYVTGRAGEGHVDDTGPAIVRVVGAASAPKVLDALESHGLSPMEVSSLATRMGSLAVAHIIDGSLHVDLLFLPDQPASHEPSSIVDGEAVSMVDIGSFSLLIQALRAASASDP